MLTDKELEGVNSIEELRELIKKVEFPKASYPALQYWQAFKLTNLLHNEEALQAFYQRNTD